MLIMSQEECWLEYYVNKNKKTDGIDRVKTLILYENYKEWVGLTSQSFKMEKRKFLIQLKNTIANTTKQITYVKTGGNIKCKFDWEGIIMEGKINIFDDEGVENTEDIDEDIDE